MLLRSAADRVPAWGAPAAVGAIGVALVGGIATLDPTTRASLSPGCPFRALTGLDCPGCGGTRALYAITQGDLALAADHNLLVVALLPILVAVWAVWLVRRLRSGHSARAPVPPATVSLGIAAAMTLFAVARNLPWMPFAWLGSLPSG